MTSSGIEVPRKYPIFAGVASFVIPGAGQAFCGRFARGLGWFLGAALFVAVCNQMDIWWLLIPALGLHGAAAEDAYRCALQRARREFELEPPVAPSPEQPPVSKAVRLLAALTACWLLPNAVVLAAMAVCLFFAVPLSIIWGFLAWSCWSYGQEALTLAKGLRLRTVVNGWTGTKSTVTVRGLKGGIVLAVVGIFGWLLMVSAFLKFGELLRRPNEGESKGSLGAMRSALSIYYGDMEGQYPADMAALTIGGRYLSNLPKAKAPNYHPDSSAMTYGKQSNDAGGWLYNNTVGDANIGNVLVNCTHTDTRGTVWTYY